LSIFVLVHGAWHGGWCWQRLTPLLRAAGHEVFTPTLTGLGERAHLARPEVDLETHIKDVTALLDMEDLREVILVGHSYAGFVITGVADRDAARLRHIVYLDAFVPQDGKSLADSVPGEDRTETYEASVAEGIKPFPPQAFGIMDPHDAHWAGERLVYQPARSFTQRLHLTNPPPKLRRSYIEFTDPAMGPFTAMVEALRKDPAWTVSALATGHDAMITAPRALAKLLRAAA